MQIKAALDTSLQAAAKAYKRGHVATYIPALGRVTPSLLGGAQYDLASQQLVTAGDAHVRFAVESISKVPVLMLAIEERGTDAVFKMVDAEPTGFPFNSLLNMEINQRKTPMNPFVNQGAIVVNSLIDGENSDERFQAILTFMRELCDDDELALNEEVYKSESKTGDMNRCLAYYMKAKEMFHGDVEDVLDSYFKQCSINVTAVDLARLGAVLANGGKAPWNGHRLVKETTARVAKSLMTTAGLYDESGDFSVHVGVPAKSGVGGGLMVAVPHKCGIGVFGPALDTAGNSVSGIQFLRKLITEQKLNIFG